MTATDPEPGGRGIGPAGSAVAPAVELVGITKRFGDVVACEDVDLQLYGGTVHGLLGQNGAGKSTLMKVVLGLMTPDAGHVRLNGEPVVIADPLHAASLGMSMVHQHFSLVDALTVWENVALGDRGRLDPTAAASLVESVGERYGLDVDPQAVVGDLSAGQRQRVELIKCLRRDPSILVLDEPTSVLTRSESQQLFSVLRRVVEDEGRAVVLISHKLDEILHATDEITIMRAGQVVARTRSSDTTPEALAREMVGRTVQLRADSEAALGFSAEAVEEALEGEDDDTGDEPCTGRRVALQMKDVSAARPDGSILLDDLSLEVRAGEILGLAGVDGNGQTSVTQVLSSLLRPDRGTVLVDGEEVRVGRPGAAVRAGIGVIPEDRHRSGCVLDMSVAENLAYLNLDQQGGMFLDRKAMRQRALELVEEYQVSLPSVDTPMRLLSGGNQQKVVLARELSRGPKVLIAEQPTHGLDIGAVEYMFNRLRQAASEGIGVLLISTELEELVALADRIAVIYRGRIMGEMSAREVDLERLGLMMGGRTA